MLIGGFERALGSGVPRLGAVLTADPTLVGADGQERLPIDRDDESLIDMLGEQPFHACEDHGSNYSWCPRARRRSDPWTAVDRYEFCLDRVRRRETATASDRKTDPFFGSNPMLSQ
jgi:hypothetical protein